MTRLRGLTIALVAANVALAIGQVALMHRTAAMFHQARAILNALPDHECGPVIEPGENCAITLMLPRPDTPAARRLQFHGP